MQEDPAFYRRFSEMLEDAIRAFREQRLSDAEYLRKVTEIIIPSGAGQAMRLPTQLQGRPVAQAFLRRREGMASPLREQQVRWAKAVGTEAGMKIDESYKAGESSIGRTTRTYRIR